MGGREHVVGDTVDFLLTVANSGAHVTGTNVMVYDTLSDAFVLTGVPIIDS